MLKLRILVLHIYQYAFSLYSLLYYYIGYKIELTQEEQDANNMSRASMARPSETYPGHPMDPRGGPSGFAQQSSFSKLFNATHTQPVRITINHINLT